jgi:hypothetical protein
MKNGNTLRSVFSGNNFKTALKASFVSFSLAVLFSACALAPAIPTAITVGSALKDPQKKADTLNNWRKKLGSACSAVGDTLGSVIPASQQEAHPATDQNGTSPNKPEP